MRVLVVAGGAEKRKEVRDAVLEALQGTGECFTTSHDEGKEICLRQKPDLVVVCDYREVSPMACAVGFQSYCSIAEITPERNVIRMGDSKVLRHHNYCQSTLSLQALVYMRYRDHGGPSFKGRH